jgi:predicted DNA-binding transcriptional regulator AlpA
MTCSLFLANGLPLRAITVPQFCQMYSLSRQTTYNMINSGQLKSVLQGGRRLISVDSAEKLLVSPRADVELIAYTCLKLSYCSISG